jgi:hypothetical protein
MRTAFQQLGNDLQSGNISAAQKDLSTITQNTPSSTSATNQSSRQPEIQQLAQDLQSGNLSGAQQDYATIQRAMQQGHTAHGHHQHGSDAASSTNSSINATDPLSLFTNLAATAASTYESAGLTSALSAGSMLSQLI